MMKGLKLLFIIGMLTLLYSSFSIALEQYTLNINTDSVRLDCLEKVMLRVESCQPIGVDRIVYNGRANGKLAGITYFSTGHIFIWAVNKQPYNLMQVTGHEINEAQCHYDCKYQKHNSLPADEWRTIKCK